MKNGTIPLNDYRMPINKVKRKSYIMNYTFASFVIVSFSRLLYITMILDVTTL